MQLIHTNIFEAEYLTNLRNNRVARPTGARPQPSTNRQESDRSIQTPTIQDDPEPTPSADIGPRSASALSHRRAQSSMSTYSSVGSRTGRQLVQQPYSGTRSKDGEKERPLLKPSQVVPSATYIERGQRWMEKEEAVSLRDAMEDMDLKKQEDEERIHAAAQNEASNLVWQHQNPGSAIRPDAPYSYKGHLRKNSYQHARTQSVGRYGGIATGLARDIAPRSFSGGSSSSEGVYSPRSRVSSGSSSYSQLDRNISPDGLARSSMDSSQAFTSPPTSRKTYGGIANANMSQNASHRRSSAKRNISGEVAGTFTGEQIWEEPEQDILDRGRSTETRDFPPPLRIKPRNPLNRVQFAQDVARSNSTPPEPTKKLSRFEIHRNPPTQSRNPAYTANKPPAIAEKDLPTPEKATKEGLEIRSDEIRQATSMRMKDRSPKLPTPTVVSDKLGRPIVSFDANWKPKEADVKPEERRESRYSGGSPKGPRQSISSEPDSKNVTASIPTIQFSDAPSIQVNSAPLDSVPSINFPDSEPSVPTINLPDSTPPVPTILLPGAPEISISEPTTPSIIIPQNSSAQPTRPLPDPKTAAGRPPRHQAISPTSRSHWSPAGKRATATCHQCRLPIEGRVVGLRGAVEKFHPQCFTCFTCGTGLEALEVFEETPQKRAERLDRIERRARGENIPEVEGQTIAEDGDARLRYFCHLDWHEMYAPKCKHCKTPILGEHTIALGEHWHFGHFFCAECGDPFEKGMTHIEKDGYAWCLSCQTKRTERRAPKCRKCRLPVIGEAIQAMGGEFHDKCFRCITCRGDFPDGAFFPKEVGNETVVMCTKCMERELKA